MGTKWVLFLSKCFHGVFLPNKKKRNYHIHNVETWRCYVECDDLNIVLIKMFL